jgi:hypothetical protein
MSPRARAGLNWHALRSSVGARPLGTRGSARRPPDGVAHSAQLVALAVDSQMRAARIQTNNAERTGMRRQPALCIRDAPIGCLGLVGCANRARSAPSWCYREYGCCREWVLSRSRRSYRCLGTGRHSIPESPSNSLVTPPSPLWHALCLNSSNWNTIQTN